MAPMQNAWYGDILTSSAIKAERRRSKTPYVMAGFTVKTTVRRVSV